MSFERSKKRFSTNERISTFEYFFISTGEIDLCISSKVNRQFTLFKE